MNTSYDFHIPIDALVNHLLKGRRLRSLLGTTSIEHIAPFLHYMSPRASPEKAAEIEHTFLLRTESAGTGRDGRGPRTVFHNEFDAVWAFLRTLGGGAANIIVEEVPITETDELTLMALKEDLLEGHRLVQPKSKPPVKSMWTVHGVTHEQVDDDDDHRILIMRCGEHFYWVPSIHQEPCVKVNCPSCIFVAERL